MFFVIVFILFFKTYNKSKDEYYRDLNFKVSKIDTLENNSIKINDTFLSPNFRVYISNDLKLNDSIVKKQKSSLLYIYRGKKVVDSVKNSGLFYN